MQAKHKIQSTENDEDSQKDDSKSAQEPRIGPYKILDPKLTVKGRSQCEESAALLQPNTPYITNIISSPLSRSLDTGLLAFKDIPAEMVIFALPELQSLGDGPNATGLSCNELREHFSDQKTDNHA